MTTRVARPAEERHWLGLGSWVTQKHSDKGSSPPRTLEGSVQQRCPLNSLTSEPKPRRPDARGYGRPQPGPPQTLLSSEPRKWLRL